MAKKGKIDMGKYLQTTLDRKAMSWCVKNGVFISPKAINTMEWSIVIEQNKREHESPETYGKVVIWEKVFEFYRYYYDKRDKNELQ